MVCFFRSRNLKISSRIQGVGTRERMKNNAFVITVPSRRVRMMIILFVARPDTLRTVCGNRSRTRRQYSFFSGTGATDRAAAVLVVSSRSSVVHRTARPRPVRRRRGALGACAYEDASFFGVILLASATVAGSRRD